MAEAGETNTSEAIIQSCTRDKGPGNEDSTTRAPSGEPVAEQRAQAKSATGADGKIHSSFGTWEKRFIVLVASLSGAISPFTTNIYFPALNTLASDLGVTISQINLTITTYMIFQGLAPTFIGGISDDAGRRPALILCFVIYICANIGLAVQNNYAALLVLRCLQSSGSSGTVALAYAIIADVITSAERGSYIGFTSLGSILGPSLGPVIGGLLSQYLGWKAIFWFLSILGGILLIPLFLAFPETCRKIVGDGTIPPQRWNRSLRSYLIEKNRLKAGIAVDNAERDRRAKKRHLSFPNPLAVLKIVVEKEAALILLFAGVYYAGFYGVTSSLSTQFSELYHLNNLQLGLAFIPLSLGSLAAAITNGRLVDANYRRHAKRLGMPVDRKKQRDLRDFPIESVRLEIGIPFMYAAAVFVIIYGWLINYQVHVAGPLVVLFFTGYSVVASFNTFSILGVDIYPGQAATVSAANNLVRCLLGAGGTAIINPLILAFGRGWAFTFIALMWVALSPMLFAVVRWGPAWRKKRIELKEAKERKEEAENEQKVAKLEDDQNAISEDKPDHNVIDQSDLTQNQTREVTENLK